MAARSLLLVAALVAASSIADAARALRNANSTQTGHHKRQTGHHKRAVTEVAVAGKGHAVMYENVSFVAHSIAKAKRKERTRDCGPNTLEVGKDIYQDVMAESTHIDYLCECLETDVVESLYVGDDNMRAKIGTSGASKDFPEGSAEKRLCQAIEYISMFVNEDSCQYWVSPDSMDDLCSEHYQYDL
eukprot:gnl/TRDRNA2_/TRDRNA2_167088_c0_seq1.p1 gnl/TRDRNA2_/TRDRNA2_167088_c0~~gnl/TRDRNA2_/TRDRNA2_167088_c0_seq1.p1  ORF type:complete len:187 (+),score=31.08 gnl/TRDRNA2_/TRDRNA2_167088_c0_seq1:47-607(+)